MAEGISLADMDTTVSVKNDFYRFVNGSWLDNTTIPDDESTWGSFNILRKSTRIDLLDMMALARESQSYAAETDQGKALSFFETAIDTTVRNESGTKPLEPLLNQIEGVSSLAQAQALYAKSNAIGAPFAHLAVFGDLNNSSMNAAYIVSGSLGLPDRDFYVLNDDKSKEIRQQYTDYVAEMLQHTGYSESEAKSTAERILELETQLAEPRMDKVQRRDIRNMNNPRTLQELQQMVPAYNWNQFIADSGSPKKLDTVIVTDLNYMTSLQNFLVKTPLADIKTLMKWSTINSAAPYLSTALEKAHWSFYSGKLRGEKAMKPLNERALGAVNGGLGEALGQVYVDAKFPPEAKEKAEGMIANVILAFKGRIQNLEWMGDSTKVKAIEKLDKFTVKIGYPDEWEDYSTMNIKQDNGYYENQMAIWKWGHEKSMSEIGQPVDKKEWGMSPQTVNAYFNPLNNEIVFPAAILQPPYYNYLADDAVNYGAMGAVIGHEISHSFDDSGSRFDADGNVNNWWTEEDLAEFEKRTAKLAEQYSTIEVLDSVYINGKFTLGENIGDLGGLLGAYDALQLHMKENGRPEKIDGFTPEQRFFMSWATVWRTLSRDDALRNQVQVDPHSPGRYRGTQPLKNIDAFYEAFDIKEGDDMYLAPEDRVRIW
jgi:putative endopeptidase